MARLAFIGDELTAAGFRLAGVNTHTPDGPHTPELFAKLRQECELLLMTQACARELPDGVLGEALREGAPLVLIVPDLLGKEMPPDLVRGVNRALGIES